jgi:hypothetical protein
MKFLGAILRARQCIKRIVNKCGRVSTTCSVETEPPIDALLQNTFFRAKLHRISTGQLIIRFVWPKEYCDADGLPQSDTILMAALLQSLSAVRKKLESEDVQAKWQAGETLAVIGCL